MESEKKDVGGRPEIVLTDEQKAEVPTLAAVLTGEQIADYFGISRSTWFRILERDEGVLTLYKKGQAKAIANIATNLIKKAQSGDLGAQVFYLKTQAGWKETQRLEGGGDNGDLVVAYKWIDDDNEDD